MPRFFGQADGIRFKQAGRLELCGVALSIHFVTYVLLLIKAKKSLFVYISTIANLNNLYQQNIIVNGIDHPVVSYS